MTVQSDVAPKGVKSPPEKLNPMARRALAAGTVGTLIEWYDYGLYGAAAGLIIGELFFPTFGGTGGALAAFATFAVGFFVRPVGGMIIAHFGDKYGRKPVLIGTIVMMGTATVLMGLLPTYNQIGIWAVVLLIFLRMVQGAGAGAELAGAMTMVAEFAPKNRRAFVTAIPNGCGAGGGVMLATMAFLIVSSLPDDAMLSWGWRIPFLLSGLLFGVAVYIRYRLEETPEYSAAKEQALSENEKNKVPLIGLLKDHPREVIFGALSGTALNATFYVLLTFSGTYMVNTLNMTRFDSLVAMSVTAFAGACSAPITGRIADHVGARSVYRAGGVLLVALAFPLFLAFESANLVVICIAMATCSFFIYGCSVGGQGAFLANLFATRYRFSGIAITREMNALAVAGPTPFVAAALVGAMGGAPWLVAAYLAACGLITVLSATALRKSYDE